MFDLLLVAVGLEAGFSLAYAPELAAVVGEDFSGLSVFMDGLVE